MSTPTLNSAEYTMARALTDAALAQRLDMLVFNRRAFDKVTTNALLGEAARRLRWALRDGREVL